MTGASPLRRIPVATRRDILIDSAIVVIARDGLAASTTRAIVAEAGMPLGSFHYAFESRDSLLDAVIDRVTGEERMAAESTLVTGDTRPSLHSVVLRGIERYIDMLEAHPEREQALLELHLWAIRRRDPAEAEPGQVGATGQYRAYYAAAEHLLHLASDTAAQSFAVPITEVARLLVALLDGITTTWLADRDGVRARRTATLAASALAALAVAPERSVTHAH